MSMSDFVMCYNIMRTILVMEWKMAPGQIRTLKDFIDATDDLYLLTEMIVGVILPKLPKLYGGASLCLDLSLNSSSQNCAPLQYLKFTSVNLCGNK